MKKLSSLKDAVNRFKTSHQNPTAAWPENLAWISIDKIPSHKKNVPSPSLPVLDPSDLAFLQFTSGSTSAPKGVMISHSNLADNLSKITSELGADGNTVVVSWLPQYHDMGLIGSYLGVLYCGGSGFYISPLTYLQRPALWIEAISLYKGTHLQAPNFAFKLTARKFDPSKYGGGAHGQGPKIDLSSVKHIINAAEPVTEDGIDAFCSVFCPLGLNKNVIYPTYGLAEHTVFVCSGGTQRLTVSKQALEVDGVVKEIGTSAGLNLDAQETSRLIGCGYPAKQNVDVQIVSTETFEALEQDRVGEIWIRSGSKAAGYYQKPFETRRDFCAVIGDTTAQSEDANGTDAAVDASGGYLRSGDLGFLHNDELFICGRIKDLIIVGGRNYYPQDIEATAEASDSRIRPGCSAAFTVDPISGEDEHVALVFELREVSNSQVSHDIFFVMVATYIIPKKAIAMTLQSHSMPFTTKGLAI
jgi:acyl-CoA synthetase (AMP-forming)/AMP-acid ligase II